MTPPPTKVIFDTCFVRRAALGERAKVAPVTTAQLDELESRLAAAGAQGFLAHEVVAELAANLIEAAKAPADLDRVRHVIECCRVLHRFCQNRIVPIRVNRYRLALDVPPLPDPISEGVAEWVEVVAGTPLDAVAFDQSVFNAAAVVSGIKRQGVLGAARMLDTLDDTRTRWDGVEIEGVDVREARREGRRKGIAKIRAEEWWSDAVAETLWRAADVRITLTRRPRPDLVRLCVWGCAIKTLMDRRSTIVGRDDLQRRGLNRKTKDLNLGIDLSLLSTTFDQQARLVTADGGLHSLTQPCPRAERVVWIDDALATNVTAAA